MNAHQSLLALAGLAFASLNAAEPQTINPIAPTGETLRNDPFGKSVRPAPGKLAKDEGWLIAGLVNGPKSTDRLDEDAEIRITGFKFISRGQGGNDGQELSGDINQVLLDTAHDFLGLAPSQDLSSMIKLGKLQELAHHLAVNYKEMTGVAMPVFIIGEQDVTDGILRFDVIEGFLEEVEFSGDAKTPAPKASDAMKTMRSLVGGLEGRVIKQDAVERAVILLQEITGDSYSVQYGTGKEAFGVRMRVLPRGDQQDQGAFLGSLRVDNQGSPNLGQTQFSTQLAWRPDWVYGDQLGLNYVTSELSSALAAYTLTYDSPLGRQGWRGGVRLSKVNYEVGGVLAAAQAQGLSETVGLYATYPILRTFSRRLDATFGLARTKLEDRTIGTSNPRTNDSLTAELRGVSTQASHSQTWSVAAALSDLNFDSAAQAAADSLGVKGAALTLNAEYRRVDWLTREIDLTYGVRAQWSGSNLDGFQKMWVGGMNGVRAFAPSELSGDHAIVGRIELGYTIRSSSWANRLSVFYDQGEAAISKNPLSDSGNRLTLAGAGLQWQFNSDFGLGGRVYAAAPTANSSRTVSSVDAKSERLGFELNYNF